MEKLKNTNKLIGELAEIMQEQECEIQQLKFEISKHQKVFKILNIGTFNIFDVVSDFDKCKNKEDLLEKYKKYLKINNYIKTVKFNMEVKLAKEIWEKHIDIFQHFDLVCNNGSSLEDETKSNALFNAIVTLEVMKKRYKDEKVDEAINYLKGSKYYSESNCDANY